MVNLGNKAMRIIDRLGDNSAGDGMEYVVAAGVQISQGIGLVLTDGSVAAAATNADASSAIASVGISGFEKKAGSDTSTTITALTNVRVLCNASGAINAGESVCLTQDNYVIGMPAGSKGFISGAIVFGVSEDDLADSAAGGNVTVRVRK